MNTDERTMISGWLLDMVRIGSKTLTNQLIQTTNNKQQITNNQQPIKYYLENWGIKAWSR